MLLQIALYSRRMWNKPAGIELAYLIDGNLVRAEGVHGTPDEISQEFVEAIRRSVPSQFNSRRLGDYLAPVVPGELRSSAPAYVVYEPFPKEAVLRVREGLSSAA